MINAAITPYSPYVDNSFANALLGYTLAKFSISTSVARWSVRLPLLSGYFATFFPCNSRPLHTVSFLTPINDDPSSESTAEACLLSTKEILLDSKYQSEAILVVDEKIYRSCMKVRKSCPTVPHNLISYLICFVGQAPSSQLFSSCNYLCRRFPLDEELNDRDLGHSRRVRDRRHTRSHL
jgi:hypothetical protein